MLRVAVLLAAYNGEKHISEQVDSVLAQVGVDPTIYINIDRSSDNTLALIEGYQNRDPRVRLLKYEDRFGSAELNFYDLIASLAGSSFDFYALADQDDIWEPDKLKEACSVLNEQGFDCYSGSITAMYPDGRNIYIPKSGTQTPYDHFFQSAGPGCTYVFTRAAYLKLSRALIERREDFERVLSHDWALYYVARQFGLRWFIDERSFMSYRQHGNNDFGANIGIFAALNRVQRFRSGWYASQVYNLERLDSKPGVSGLIGPYPGKLHLWVKNFRYFRRFLTQSLFLLVMRLCRFF